MLGAILRRSNSPLNIASDLIYLKGKRILITGANGSLGIEVTKYFLENEINFLATDKDSCDVEDIDQVLIVTSSYNPTHILHLAADKHAPEGELFPSKTFSVNTLGTLNVLKAAKNIGSRVLLASTCKSCDPETVYGSSKLIAERLTINAGGTVARFFNVVETSGNVFEIWKNSESEQTIKVTNCFRYFMSTSEAVSLLIKSLVLSDTSPGRYIFDPGVSHFMPDIAARLYPNRTAEFIAPRRGDRFIEPLKATSERLTPLEERLIKVESPHDPEFISN